MWESLYERFEIKGDSPLLCSPLEIGDSPLF